ncbi:MAG: hypothetical protein HKN87_09565 [Saprospiraceae bacterium]|nr:hypothetical protein [Saprospiraceae bacterium]
MIADLPSKKKVAFPVSDQLDRYLLKYNNKIDITLQYEDLLRYQESVPLLDLDNEDTLWRTVYYSPSDQQEINRDLKLIYAYLKTDGDVDVIEHLSISRIDYCTFGNTQPFRIRIINKINDNYDHYYIKKVDASRIYGLELENLVSPNRFDYFLNRDSLIEEHIPGIPGDVFMKQNLDDNEFNQIRMAKEFIKFNERCFIRLLGDMRAYNYVVDITPDIEGSQFRLRAIDFDQQSYEGRKSFYLPQYFKDNNPIIFLGIKHMKPKAVLQYQQEERTLVAGRIKNSRSRLKELFNIMIADKISTKEKRERLKAELRQHHKTDVFDSCKSMGAIVRMNFRLLLQKDFKQSTFL